MKNYSIFKEGVDVSSYKELDKNLDVDVLIIGGGITGINTLYQFRNSSLKVVLVEQNKIGHGVTCNSTGKLNYLQDSIYEKIIKIHGEERASEYLNSQKDAIKLVVDIIKKENIDCDLVKVPSYVYTNKDDEIEKLKKFRNFMESTGTNIFIDNSDFVKSKYLFGVDDTYIFNSLKYVVGLANCCFNDNIYENTSIKKIECYNNYYVCYTDSFKVKTKWVVIASHYPYFNLPFMFPIKGYLEKSYLSASKYDKKDISLISYDKPVVSLRNYNDYLIYLSNSHNVGRLVNDKENFDELKKKVNDLGLDIEYLWSNMDIITNDGLPYIGKIKDKLLIGTGYNTWGLATGTLAGKILADIINNVDNKYVELFNPKRSNLGMIIGGVIDGVVSLEGYFSGLTASSKNVSYEKVDGLEIAIYKDENGEHKVYTKCPHMGCRLIFNEVEHTWDCPCHASRFDIDGKCISGPSNEGIGVN